MRSRLWYFSRNRSKRPGAGAMTLMLALLLILWLPVQSYAAITGCCHAAMAGDVSMHIEDMPACHDMMLPESATQTSDQSAPSDQQQASFSAGCDHCAGCHFASSSMSPPPALFAVVVPAGRVDASAPLSHISTPYPERPQRPPLARLA